MPYYFAYGSNMDEVQMMERCPKAKLITKARLPGYMLGFTIYSPKRKCGCADIIKNESQSVWGLVYDLTLEDITSLDKYEGTPDHYRRISVSVVDDTSRVDEVETYEVAHKNPESQKPSKNYLNKLIVAAEEFDFPIEYQNRLKQIETSD